MGGLPLGVRILGPLVLSGAVVNNPMADVVPGSRCAFSHSGSMDRTSLVSPAGEPSDYAGYSVASRGTISLTWRLGRAVRLYYVSETAWSVLKATFLPSLLESKHPSLLS